MANLNIVTLSIPISKSSPRRQARAYKQGWWLKFEEPAKYIARKDQTRQQLESITAMYPNENSKLIAKVTVTSGAVSKTTIPKEIFAKSNIATLYQPTENTIILSGRISDFKSLTEIVRSSTFEIAKKTSAPNESIIARELFEITDVIDINTNIEERLDKNLYANSDSDIVWVTIYTLPKTTSTILVKLYDELVGVVDSDEFIYKDEEYTDEFPAKLKVSTIKSILTNPTFLDIQFIEKMRILETQRSIQDNNFQLSTLAPVESDLHAMVIDDGIDSRFVSPVVDISESFVPSHKSATNTHGTFVASRIIYGHQISTLATGSAPRLTPLCKLIDITVHTEKSSNIRDPGENAKIKNELMRAIKTAVSKYKEKAFIINLSINEDTYSPNQKRIDKLTKLIDDIQRETGVLFVISAGNFPHFGAYLSSQYSYLYAPENRITSPADSINAVSVGSITEVADAHSVVELPRLPSPFTRRGGIFKYLWQKKPDFVEIGGNTKIDPTGAYLDSSSDDSDKHYGVEGIVGDEIRKGVGTSYSAPLVTRTAVQIADYLYKAGFLDKPLARGNILKALLIHSARGSHSKLEFPSNVKKKELCLFYGYGIPDIRNLELDKKALSLAIADCFLATEWRHKQEIKIPERFIGQKVTIHFTLVFNPPTEPSSPEQYSDVVITSSLKFLSTDNGISFGTSGSNQKNKYSNVVNVLKKQVTVTSNLLTLSLELHERRKNPQIYPQWYCAVLTLETTDETFYQEVVELNALIRLQAQARVQVTSSGN